MTLSEYLQHDAVGLADLVRRREVSPAEVRQAALAATAAANPALNAVVEAWTDEPLAKRDESGAWPPLAGAPIFVKDLAIAVKGRRSELGSRLAAGVTAPTDSLLTQKLRAAGLTLMGRTTTPEMAISTTTEPVVTGATRNPWDLGRSAGGSSGGSGVAVASGMVPLAHGTDAGGSIRVPAAAVGVFGLKPTRGRVSFGPAVDEVWSGLATQFALSRSVRDSAALLDAVHDGALGEPYQIAPPSGPYTQEITRDPPPLRIGLMPHPLGGRRSTPATVAAVEEVARLCAELGHAVEPVALDVGADWPQVVDAYGRIEAANTAAWMQQIAQQTGRRVDPDTVEPATLSVYNYGLRTSAIELLSALEVRNTVTRRLSAWFADRDVLLSPTLAEAPLPIGEYNRPQSELDGPGWIAYACDRAPFSSLANIAGLPAMSAPLSMDAELKLPIGSQFIAGFGREDLLFRLAAQLEKAAPWAERRPPYWAGLL